MTVVILTWADISVSIVDRSNRDKSDTLHKAQSMIRQIMTGETWLAGDISQASWERDLDESRRMYKMEKDAAGTFTPLPNDKES